MTDDATIDIGALKGLCKAYPGPYELALEEVNDDYHLRVDIEVLGIRGPDTSFICDVSESFDAEPASIKTFLQALIAKANVVPELLQLLETAQEDRDHKQALVEMLAAQARQRDATVSMLHDRANELEQQRDHARAWAYWHLRCGKTDAPKEGFASDGWDGLEPPKPPIESTSAAGLTAIGEG